MIVARREKNFIIPVLLEVCDDCRQPVGPSAIDNRIDEKVQCRRCFFKQYPALSDSTTLTTGGGIQSLDILTK